MSSIVQRRYRYPQLSGIEDLEEYRPGGLHPVSIGDILGGRYRVLHKLGFGGSSTVWLAQEQDLSQESGSLVALKIMSADQSSKAKTEIPDWYIPQEAQRFSRTVHHPGGEIIQNIRDHFTQDGPNGSHLCLISQFAGPTVLSMSECPGRTSGSRRLRGDLARKIARQVAAAVECLHAAGIVHGDLTSSNILFRLSDEIHQWTVDEVYNNLGHPELEEVTTYNLGPPGPFGPCNVIGPVNSSLLPSSLLREDVLLIDFGQSFFTDHLSVKYDPATPLHYLSPEGFFESKTGFASDVWALACVIFEIRAGAPLFDPFLSGYNGILKQIVETLGRFPDLWWSSWDARQRWFDERGAPRPVEEQIGVLLPATKSSLRRKLLEIGGQDDAPYIDEGNMIERTGTPLTGAEVELLSDLLEKMLRYRPGDRITIREAVKHPWFSITDDD